MGMRTNHTAAQASFRVSGSYSVAVQCSVAYQDGLGGFTPVPGLLAYRVYPATSQLTDEPWKTVPADGQLRRFNDQLSPGVEYTVEMRVARVGTAVDGLREAPSNLERFREPEEGLPPISSDPVGGFGPSGYFLEISDIQVTSGAAVGAHAWDITNSLDVLVIGDGMADGIMVEPEGHRNDLGMIKGVVWLALERAASTMGPARRLVVVNASYDGNHFGALAFPRQFLDNTIVSSLGDFKEGVATDVDSGALVPRGQRQDYPGDASAIYDRLTLARTHSFTPDLVVVALGRQDQDFQDPADLGWRDKVSSDLVGLVLSVRTDYSDVPVCVVTPHTAGQRDILSGEDTVVRAMNDAVATLLGAPHNVPASELKIVNLDTEVADRFPPDEVGTYLTEAQADELAGTTAALLPIVQSLVAPLDTGVPSLVFSSPANSQYLALGF